jgi:UDP-glucose 4-epimerase
MQAVRNYRDVFGLKALSLRFFNVYGPRQDPASPYSAVIPRFIRRCVGGRPIVFGTGAQTRDFVYVGDIVSGLIAAAEAPALPAEHVVNLCSGAEVSVMDLAKKIMAMMQIEGEPDFEPAKAGEVPRSAGSNALARRTLNWEPRRMLEDGLKETEAWIMKTV